MSRDMNALKDFLLTGVTEQVKHEYETEEEFDEIYGPTDTIDEVINLLCDLKCNEDICRVYCPACLDADPENYKHYLNLFGLDLDEVENLDGKKYTEYIASGYDKDGGIYKKEYYRGIEKDKAIEIAKKKTALGDSEVEVVTAEAEEVEDYQVPGILIWASYAREEEKELEDR